MDLRHGRADLEFKGAKACAATDLDGSGKVKLESGSGFLDHMLNAFSRTGRIDLEAMGTGFSYYRSVALGRALGLSIDKALGDRSGIRRYGSSSVPMDESLADVALDLSGRPYLVFQGGFLSERIGDLDIQEIKAFMEALSDGGRLTLHIRFYGENDHHKAEGIFKALGLALREAVRVEGTEVPSTKGVI